ncbi:hypothetical protein BC831DRAFT_51427 [Entophlyctis helioformis]|nr:hypothetical protein BC831DRAFT_51427 [Entophlyctis helioformis]
MVFPTALFIPFVGALMLPFDCRAGFACSSSLYVAGTVVAAFGLAMFFIESVYMTVFFFDADPTQKNPWNVYNARVDMLLVLLKAGLVSMAVFAPENDFFGRALPATVVPLVMFIMHNLFFPHYNIYMTQARCGIYFGAFFHGVAAIICGAVSGGTTVIESATGAMMTIFCVMVPIGAYISGRVFTYTQSTLLAKINERKALSYSRGVWSDDLNIFRMWPHVEITARFATAHLFGRRRPRKEDFALVICIFRRGLAEFPNNPYVMSLYAQYLSKFVGDNEHALHVANKIDIERTYMDTQFQIYMMLETKEKDKELEFLDINTHLDRATLNEYSRIIMDTKLNHYMTLHYTRLIWAAVLDKKYDAGRIENLAEQLQLTILKAEDGYVKLMERFPNSSRVRRYYSYFCLWTLNADVKANRLLMEADQRDRQRSEQESRSGGNRERTAYTDIVIPARMLQTSKASTEENREKESKRLRLKLLKRNSGDIRKLLYATTIIGIISTTVLIVGHTVVAQLLETSIHEYKFTKKIIMRDLGTALLWRRCRQLQTAYENSKPVEFKAIQDKLYKEMVSFQENARAMFADTASSSILVDGQRAFSDPWITYKQSFYPELQVARSKRRARCWMSLCFSATAVSRCQVSTFPSSTTASCTITTTFV